MSTSQRFLRSHAKRALLWYATNGRCALCGCPLPDAWHADHIIPWHVSHQTNLHKMQPLCPACNRKKGGRMPALWRDFQVHLRDMIDNILAENALPWAIYGDVVPGGGKSSIPLLLTRLIPKYADKIMWVVPRASLADQAVESFDNEHFRQLFGHQARCSRGRNRQDPSRGLLAYSITYQAIKDAPYIHEEEMRSGTRYILVLDEPHHAWREGSQLGPYARALQPLVEHAVLRVFMSGTFERWDKKPIAYMPYKAIHGGAKLAIDFPEEWTVRYRRLDALVEKAIVPVYFNGSNAAGRYIDKNGEEKGFRSFDDEEAELDNGGMLRVALHTDYARDLLCQTLDHWQAHRQYWPKAKCLVVAPFIEVARQYAKWIYEDRGLTVPIAVTGDQSNGTAILNRFRTDPNARVLVTVGMAYEGLDVKELTHLACMTLYRSKPWIHQCFARVWRWAEGKDAGYIFTPDDPLMQNVIAEIREEQLTYAEQPDTKQDEEPRGGGVGPQAGREVPLGSKVTGVRSWDFEGELTEEERLKIVALQQRHPILQGFNPMQLREVFQDWAEAEVQEEDVSLETLEKDLSFLHPNVVDAHLLKAIEKYTRAVDAASFGCRWGTTNGRLIQHFGKDRHKMRTEDLKLVWQYLNERYPLKGLSTETPS